MIKKNKPIPLDKFISIIKSEYMYIRIIPHKSIRNYNTDNIAKAIALTYKSLFKRVRLEQKKLWIEGNFKVSYIIDIENNNAEFYFMVPKVFKNILVEKVKEVWSQVTVDEVASIDEISPDCIKYQLVYLKEDALSLDIDKRTNETLGNILNVLEIMKDDDRVTVFYNFLPRSQYGFLTQYKNTIKRFKDKKPLDRDKSSIQYILKSALGAISDTLQSVLEVVNDFIGGKSKSVNLGLVEALATALEENKVLSNATKQKEFNTVIDAQMIVLSNSKDVTRKEVNAISVCNSFRALDGDNELRYKRIKGGINLETTHYNNVEVNTFSTNECQCLIQLPGREILNKRSINHINVIENPVPKELQEGYLSLGVVTCKGKRFYANIEDHYHYGNLPLTLIGAQGSGKTTYIGNYCGYANNRKESIILPDFIKNCELSEDIKKVIPSSDIVEIDLSSESGVQGLGYNEIKILDNMSSYEKARLANLQTQQILLLVDSISVGDPLSSRMRRFLSSAADVVFVQGCNSVKNVIECLQSCKKRQGYINNLSLELKDILQDSINTIEELNEYDKKTNEVIGTKESKIEHILDRVNMLREDFTLKYMYNKSLESNIDLVECMEQGKVVLIKMKESDFPSKMVKNILVTYWISKIWLASQLRGTLNEKPSRCHVIIDEVFQAPTCLKNLEYILPQARKFGLKFIFSTQYMRQLEKIFDTLEASGSSYMLLKGCTEDDFKHFQSKLNGYEFEDLRDMEKYHALNLIYYSKGYASFISELPKPIKS